MISQFVKAALLTIVFSISAGCVTAPRDVKTITDAEVGPYPADYQFTVQSYFEQVLKDPDSAQYQWPGKPFKGYARVNLGKDMLFGWVVPVIVNAKNSYGGYTGWKDHHVLVIYDKVAHHIQPDIAYPEPWLNGLDSND